MIYKIMVNVDLSIRGLGTESIMIPLSEDDIPRALFKMLTSSDNESRLLGISILNQHIDTKIQFKLTND